MTSERGATCGSELRGCIISHHYKSKNTVVQHGNMELIRKMYFLHKSVGIVHETPVKSFRKMAIAYKILAKQQEQ